MTKLPETAPDVLRLQGHLTAREVTDCHQQSLSWRRGARLPGVVELREVERIDSSALALLLEWQSWARAKGATIEFRNPPEALRTFASLSAASDLLGWQENPSSSQPECAGEQVTP